MAVSWKRHLRVSAHFTWSHHKWHLQKMLGLGVKFPVYAIVEFKVWFTASSQNIPERCENSFVVYQRLQNKFKSFVIHYDRNEPTQLCDHIQRDCLMWCLFGSRLTGFWVIDQNMLNIVLIIYSRIAWPNNVLLPLLSFSDNLPQNAYYFFLPMLIILR